MGERYRGLVLLREAFLERILANNTDVITDTPWGPGARLSRALRTVPTTAERACRQAVCLCIASAGRDCALLPGAISGYLP